MMGLAVYATAQNAIVDNGGAKDNWYVGAGVGTNVWNDCTSWTLFNAKSYVQDGVTNSWWRTQPLHADAYVGKYFTPYVGAEVDYTAVFNVRGNSQFLDAHNLTGNFVINLTNVFAGYNGKRRVFEVEFLGGLGWLHTFNPNADDANAMTVRGAVRGNINFNQKWALTITPEYVWQPKNVGDATVSAQGVNLYVGFKYRIPTKRGNFQLRRLYDQAEVDALNDQINTLHRTNADLAKANADLAETVKRLVEEGNKVRFEAHNIPSVQFEKGKSDVSKEDLCELVNTLKSTCGCITLVGCTSPEGSEAFNKKLGVARANAVKEALVSAGIDEARITVSDNYENQRCVKVSVEK